ncbi:DUF3040 domain-containing protein [Streptomyces sp. NPDC005389]|uniref:DUF3040 domain-containing protein n=1 Tax=Streptomyces sp. NPDC005389 TaxID=3157040 RepID=UPI0033B75BC0
MERIGRALYGQTPRAPQSPPWAGQPRQSLLRRTNPAVIGTPVTGERLTASAAMVTGDDMPSPYLSPAERALLAGIEQDLADDRRLERRLRRMPGGILMRARRHWLATVTLLLATASAVLAALAAPASSPPLIWAFAATWCVTLSCAIGVVLRWCASHAQRSVRSPRGGG